jgi:hypothetical protein
VQQRGLRVAILTRGLAPQLVDRRVARGGDDPPGRAGRDAVGGPALGRLRERLLDRVLGDVDVAEDAGENGNSTTVLRAERRVYC